MLEIRLQRELGNCKGWLGWIGFGGLEGGIFTFLVVDLDGGGRW